jgi:hypothetical protein
MLLPHQDAAGTYHLSRAYASPLHLATMTARGPACQPPPLGFPPLVCTQYLLPLTAETLGGVKQDAALTAPTHIR